MLGQFTFPKLTTLELSTPPIESLAAPDLLDFLRASPALQTVEMKITSDIQMGDVPQEFLIVLPNVETFSLSVNGAQIYDFAACISCPCVKRTSLIHDIDDRDVSPDAEMFPVYPLSWAAIVDQYTRSPIEDVVLEMEQDVVRYHLSSIIKYSLSFRSSDTTVLRLGFGVSNRATREDDLGMPFGEMNAKAFSQACATIRNHPSLSHLKRLRVKHRAPCLDTNCSLSMARAFGDLLGSLGPLDELVIGGDPLTYLLPFLHLVLPTYSELVFPQVKELTISGSRTGFDDPQCVDAIVGLARSQHELGIPFERMLVRSRPDPAANLAEKLRQWVGVANWSEIDLLERRTNGVNRWV